MFMISQAFSYLSSSSFQQTVVYLCSIQVSFSVCLAEVFRSDDVRKRRTSSYFSTFLQISQNMFLLKKVFSHYFKASFFL